MDPRRRASNAQEKRVAEVTGARQHAGSGSGVRRHDMHTDDALIECKTVLRGKKQITIQIDVLKSVRYHAAISDKRPELHIELQGQRWVLIPEEDYYGDGVEK